MKNHLQELNSKKRQSLTKAHDARQDWESLRDLANSILQDVILYAKEVKYYENLYIIDDRDPALKSKTNFSKFIQFYLGKRPSGRFHKETNNRGQLMKSELEVIEGGALLISQQPDGRIIFEMHPDTIENQKNAQPIVISVFKNPGKVKYHHIKEACEDFLKYAVLSSPDYVRNRIEKIELYLLTKKYKKHIWPVFKGVLVWTLRLISLAKGIIAP